METIILCGGAGTRLWPISRSRKPKHLLALTGGKSLFAQTVDRIEPISERIWCLTEDGHSAEIERDLGDSKHRMISEPARRGTAAAIALAVAQIDSADDPVLAILPADPYIPDDSAFRVALKGAEEAARARDLIVLLGLKPVSPATSYGYIRSGEALSDGLHTVAAFTEKPDRQTAEQYLRSGEYLWNLGMFVAKASVLRAELQLYAPEEWVAAEEAARAKQMDQYLALTPSSFDYRVAEKSTQMAVLPCHFAWSDLGSWEDLWEVLDKDGEGNVTQGEAMLLESKNNLIYGSGRLVTVVGLEGMIIIDTDDALLILPKERSQDVKRIVEKLKDDEKEEYL